MNLVESVSFWGDTANQVQTLSYTRHNDSPIASICTQMGGSQLSVETRSKMVRYEVTEEGGLASQRGAQGPLRRNGGLTVPTIPQRSVTIDY